MFLLGILGLKKVINVFIQKFYLSADVTFFESTAYFLHHGSSLVEAPAPIPVFSPLESSSPPLTLDELVVS